MPDKTTIVLILFAGNGSTAEQLDPLLKEIQIGLRDPKTTNCPEIHCLYQRLTDIGQQFTITSQTTDFDRTPSGGLTNFPPAGSIERSGSLSCQMTDFLNSVKQQLPASGPVHVIIGAHGIAGKGFHPTVLLRFLLLLLFSRLNSTWRRLSWRTRFRQLRQNLFATELRPGAVAMTAGDVALTLDDAELALGILKPRLQALVLHTCSLSAIETMCALGTPSFHIACQNKLRQSMKLSKWFATLASPQAIPVQVTTACLDSMKADSTNAIGCFSSHVNSSHEVTDALEKLNKLGNELFTLLTSNVPATVNAAELAIIDGQELSAAAGTTDIVAFCNSLSASSGISNSARCAATAVAGKMQSLQLGLVKNDGSTPRRFGGISLYLPLRNQDSESLKLLPESFRTGAMDWVKFAELWAEPSP